MQLTEQLNAALEGHYRIEREIGRGAMAIVYLARDLRHNRLVAVKALDPELGALVGGTRFLEEIRVTANLQHPNLLPLFDSGEADGLLYYVMPYVEGESLRSRLEREHQLPVDEAVHIAASVAGALEYAHAHGIVHRDLKPENILLQRGEPMVADFGIALAITCAGGARLTGTGISLGTPNYMSPEQATGERVIDGRSDIYSLAAVLYEMLSGQPPHRGHSVQSIIAKVVTEPVPSVRVVRPSVPEHVASAIARGLEKFAADRWSTARAFSDALTGGRPVVAGELPTAAGIRGRSTSSRRIALLTAGSLIAGFAFGALSIRSFHSDPSLATFELPLADSAAPSKVGWRAITVSPDGAVIAFVAGPTHSLFTRRLDDLTPRVLAGTESADCPSFSPDGKWIVYTSRGLLKKIALSGGSPIVLADSAGSCGVWTEGNEIVFNFRRALYRVSADGGPVSLLTRPDSSKRIGAMMPTQAVPGGKAALIAVSERMNVDYQLGVVSIPSGDVRRLTEGGTPRSGATYSAGYLVFQHGQSVVAAPFSLRALKLTGPEVTILRDTISDVHTSRDGMLAYVSWSRSRHSLVAASSGGRTEFLSGAPEHTPPHDPTAIDTGFYAWPRLSPDGRRVALELSTGPFSWDVWIYDISTHSLSPLTRNFSGHRPAQWTADGRSVLYIALDTAVIDQPSRLVSQPWDASEPPQTILRLPANTLLATVGPPHSYAVLVRKFPFVAGDIWLVPLDTPSAARPFVATKADEGPARISPDGRLLAYVSDETGRSEIYVRPVPGPGGRVQVSADGGGEPAWGGDGKELYYRGANHVMRANLSTGAALGVRRLDTLFSDTFEHRDVTNFDVFPDGKKLLMIQGTRNVPHVGIIFNFPELLRRRAAVR